MPFSTRLILRSLLRCSPKYSPIIGRCMFASPTIPYPLYSIKLTFGFLEVHSTSGRGTITITTTTTGAATANATATGGGRGGKGGNGGGAGAGGRTSSPFCPYIPTGWQVELEWVCFFFFFFLYFSFPSPLFEFNRLTFELKNSIISTAKDRNKKSKRQLDF